MHESNLLKENQILVKEATIYVVATPIGNLEDITLRAIRILKDCDIIAAEDTRVSLKLLNHLQIKNKKIISYYDQTEQTKAKSLIEKIKKESLSLTLISDAGTPLISDPGYHLIHLAHQKNVKVVPVPGASSLTSLVSSSGLPNSKIHFVGFLPKKDNLKKKEISNWIQYEGSIVFFESTHRIINTLEMISNLSPSCEVCIGKELTKLHETIKTDSCQSILKWLKEEVVLKGELVVMVSLPKEEVKLSSEEMRTLIKNLIVKNPSLSTKEISDTLKDKGFSKKDVYNLVLDEKKKL